MGKSRVFFRLSPQVLVKKALEIGDTAFIEKLLEAGLEVDAAAAAGECLTVMLTTNRGDSGQHVGG